MKKLLAALLLTALLVGCGSGPSLVTEAPTDPSHIESTDPTTTAPTELPTELPGQLPESLLNGVPGFGNNGYDARSHYTVNTAAPDDETMSAVIGINAEEAPLFENRHLQISYWTEYLNFMNTYGSYASMFGLDTAAPLYSQNYEEGKTWEMYFLEAAVKGLARNYALAQYGADNNIHLSPEDQATIDGITTPGSNFAEEYVSQGYADADTYIQYYFGDGTNAKSYQEYYQMYLEAANVYQMKQEEFRNAITEADILAYFEENKETYASQGITQQNNVNVRHILIQPAGEQSDWTEADWTAAEAEAQAVYDEWLKEPTEEYFTALAIDKTMDPGSMESGGLYSDVYPGQMVPEFNDWCFAEGRQVGDHGIVKTTYGFHIMYFVGESESSKWYDTASNDLLYEKLSSFITECETAYPVSFDYTLMRIYDVATANAAEPVG